MANFELGGMEVAPGERAAVDLPVGSMTGHAPVALPVVVARGKKPGPTLLVSACLHGDEINGAEIVRRLLLAPALKRMRGTLLAAPVLNMPAFLTRSRYLPDRRDLNRLFPGATAGSLGARLAKVIHQTLIPRADAVVDLHTGAINRPNLPQIRVSPNDKESMRLAKAFGAPVILVAQRREGSFRDACAAAGKPFVLFESGEAGRLEAASIRFGLRGVMTVMRHLEMLPPRKGGEPKPPPMVVCRKSSWERATAGGLFTPMTSLGKAVHEGESLGFVADPFGAEEFPVMASRDGIVVGRTNEGLVDEGDALFHIAVASDPDEAEGQIAESGEALPSIAQADDDHPVHHDPFTDM
ncbi:MAG: succinylglutamate desuccinylase/aspartoacylase family protein [Akkermansiaceae bacterium]|nr:succinylglutamate desuccinylase/aspartoacylase family protein [Akkermansiaceae bacterium]NNM30187.1 succinylglutamate desuccinylase/aspartoacylase family protein [Akkermansiaceae bacterium]